MVGRDGGSTASSSVAYIPAPGSLGDNAIARLMAPAPIVLKEFLAGAATGAWGKTLVAPLERLKILYQTGRFRHVPAWRALAEVYRVEGVGGLFKGNMVAVARIAPYSALHFGAFEVYARFLRVAWGAAKATLAVEGGREGDGEDGESKGRDGREGEGEGEGEGNGRGGQGSRAAIHLVAGAGAGATAVAATYPLDLIRTRLAYIIERPGTPPGVRLNPPGPSAPRLGSSSTAAAPAGAAGRDRKTMMGMMRIILAREGVSGLYHGLGPTLLGVLPYAGLKFLVYEGLKAEYPAMVAVGKALKVGEGMEGGNGEGWAWWRMDGRIPLPVLLGFGGVAGLVAQTATYPLDVVRRRMQVQHSTAGRLQRYKGPKGNSLLLDREEIRIRSTWHGVREIARLHGWRALFYGLSINYIKAVPSTAVGFVSYDLAKEMLGVPPRSSH